MPNFKLIMSNAKSSVYLANMYFNFLEKKFPKGNLIGFCHSDFFNEFYNKSIFYKVFHKVFPNYIYSKISNKLFEICINEKPDILLIFKGMEILPSTLEKIKNQGIYLINYNLDHPFEFFSPGTGNTNILKSLILYDLHITYSYLIQKQLIERFPNINTAVLPFGFLNYSDLKIPHIVDFKEKQKICFIGNPDSYRISILEFIASEKIEIEVFGHGWEKVNFKNNNFIQVNPPRYKEDYIKTIRDFRIQLNIFRPHNAASHNMRTFEVPSVGGIMLAPYSAEQASFFTPEEESFYFSNNEDMIDKIKFILSLSLAESYQIRLKAQGKAFKSKYSYEDRANQLIEILTTNYA